MSITAADIQKRLPQEGVDSATDTHCNDWIAKATTRITNLDSRISGNDLDSLLLLECVEYGLRFLGYNAEADAERDRFKETIKIVQAKLNALKTPDSITVFKVYRAGSVPSVWSGGGRWS